MSERPCAVLVTGSRDALAADWADVVERELSAWWTAHPFLLIHGAARGIDSIAAAIAHSVECDIIPCPYIAHLGKRGGPERNRQMVAILSALRAVGYDCLVLAFHDDLMSSRGTLDCVRQATKAGHRVRLVRSDGSTEEATGLTQSMLGVER